MDRKVGGPLAAALFLAGLSAIVLWFLVFALHGALGAEVSPYHPTRADLEADGLVQRSDGMWGSRAYSVQAGDGSWIAINDAIWVGGQLGWADKNAKRGR